MDAENTPFKWKPNMARLVIKVAGLKDCPFCNEPVDSIILLSHTTELSWTYVRCAKGCAQGPVKGIPSSKSGYSETLRNTWNNWVSTVLVQWLK